MIIKLKDKNKAILYFLIAILVIPTTLFSQKQKRYIDYVDYENYNVDVYKNYVLYNVSEIDTLTPILSEMLINHINVCNKRSLHMNSDMFISIEIQPNWAISSLSHESDFLESYIDSLYKDTIFSREQDFSLFYDVIIETLHKSKLSFFSDYKYYYNHNDIDVLISSKAPINFYLKKDMVKLKLGDMEKYNDTITSYFPNATYYQFNRDESYRALHFYNPADTSYCDNFYKTVEITKSTELDYYGYKVIEKEGSFFKVKYIDSDTSAIIGKLYDLETKEPVRFALVKVKNYSDRTLINHATSNHDGEFSLELNPSVYNVTIKSIGYSAYTCQGIKVKKNTTAIIEVYLTEIEIIYPDTDYKIEGEKNRD